MADSSINKVRKLTYAIATFADVARVETHLEKSLFLLIYVLRYMYMNMFENGFESQN